MSQGMVEFVLEGEFSEIEAAQVVFHTIFGTYKEDLTILEQITTLGTREQIGKKFQGMTTCNKSSTFKPIKLTKYSKLTCSNQTGLLATAYLQTTSVPVFSGYRVQNFKDDFFEQLGKRTGTTMSAKTIPQLTATLNEVLSELRKNLIEEDKKMNMGTVEWRKVEGMHPKTGGEVLNDVVMGRCKFFLGKEKRWK